MRPEQFEPIISDYARGKKHLQLSIGIVKRGEVTYFGHRSIPRGSKPPSGDPLYEVGSITKVFTIILMQACAQDGYVSLEAPLSEYVEPLAVILEQNNTPPLGISYVWFTENGREHQAS